MTPRVAELENLLREMDAVGAGHPTVPAHVHGPTHSKPPDLPTHLATPMHHAKTWVDPSIQILRRLRPMVKMLTKDGSLKQYAGPIDQLDQALGIVYQGLVGAEEALVDLESMAGS